jgi:hypothetical protein
MRAIDHYIALAMQDLGFTSDRQECTSEPGCICDPTFDPTTRAACEADPSDPHRGFYGALVGAADAPAAVARVADTGFSVPNHDVMVCLFAEPDGDPVHHGCGPSKPYQCTLGPRV